MEFWFFMVATNLVTPFIMIGFGKLFLNNPPKKINPIFGYRTTMSMKSQETWDFAHKYCGKVWYLWGLILLPISVIPFLFVVGQNKDVVGTLGTIVCILQVIVLIVSIFPTEKALRKNFDSNGHRK